MLVDKFADTPYSPSLTFVWKFGKKFDINEAMGSNLCPHKRIL